MKNRLAMAAILAVLTGSLIVVTPGTALASPPCLANVDLRAVPTGDGNRKVIEIPTDDYSSPDWRCAMWQGMGSTGVAALQQTMNLCYYDRINVIGTRLAQDGQFGSRTRAALVKVQRYHGISADGVYGPQTASTITHTARSDSSGWAAYCGLTLRSAGLL